MKLNYKFNNLCGVVYRQGNIQFTPDGSGLVAAVGHRLTHYNLAEETSQTFRWESIGGPIVQLALSRDGRLILAVDERGGATLAHFQRQNVLGRIKFGKGGHKAKVSLVQFSPDSRKIAVVIGNLVQVWSIGQNGANNGWGMFVLEKTMSAGGEDVMCLDWSPCGRFIVAGGKDMAARILWVQPMIEAERSLATPPALTHKHNEYKPIVLSGHRHTIMGTFWSPNGRFVYTISREGVLKRWSFSPETVEITAAPDHVQLRLSPQSGAEDEDNDGELALVHAKKEHVSPVENRPWISSIAFNRVAGLVTIGFINGAFGLFSLPSETSSLASEAAELLYALSVSQHQIDTVAISSTGDWLGFGSATLGQLIVWEWRSEAYVLKQQGHLAPMTSLCYSSDGQTIASGGQDGRLKIWSAATGFAHLSFAEHRGPVVALHFVPGRNGRGSGKVLLSASNDGTVRAWDLIRCRNFRTLSTPSPVQFSCLAVDPGAEVVAAGTLDTNQIFLWNLQTGSILEVLDGHTGPVSALAFSPNGQILGSSSWDGTIRLWEPFARSSASSTQQVLQHSSAVLALAFRQDGKELAAACLSGELAFWDPHLASMTASIEARRDITESRMGSGEHFSHIAYSLDGSAIFAAGTFPWIALYDVSSRLLLRTYHLSNLHVSRDRRLILEAQGQEELPQLRQHVSGLAVSGTGRSFAVLSAEGMLVWCLDEGLVFDPVDIDLGCTPEAIRQLLQSVQEDHIVYQRALLMAFRLNIPAVLLATWAAIPAAVLPVLVPAIPLRHVPALFNLLATVLNSPQENQSIQLCLLWLTHAFQSHGLTLKAINQQGPVQGALRSIQKALTLLYADLGGLTQQNLYLLRHLLITQPST